MSRPPVNASPDGTIAAASAAPRVALTTLGCKVNQAESDHLRRRFAEAGFDLASFDDPADVYVVNTCSVTHVGDAKSRQLVREARRRNPSALVVATGCFATTAAHRFPIDGVLVVKNRDKDKVVDIVAQHMTGETAPAMSLKPSELGLVDASLVERSRAMIKVQDGCDSACSYCIIPRARGRSRSVPISECIDRVAELARTGQTEVVITGVDLGSYGHDSKQPTDLGELLREILDRTEVHRLRVSSVEPGDFDTDWLALWQDPRLCAHLHVPLQAGSDAVLQRMRRGYNTKAFWEMVDACRTMVPGVAITTDVITGFPGETDAEFAEGLNFIERCAFDGMHVFRYSRRPGTAAAGMNQTVPEEVKKQRSFILRELAQAGRERHVRRNLHSTHEVVWELRQASISRGMTGNNIRVYSTNGSSQPNEVSLCRLETPYLDGCWGEPVVANRDSELSLIAV